MYHHRQAALQRRAAGAALLVIAAVHLDIAPAHLREAPYAGVLFLALSATAIGCAIMLATIDHRLAWCSAAWLSAGAIVAYFLSRSVGLPMLGDDIGDWVNPLGVAAVASEAAVVLICAVSQRATRRYRSVSATERLYTVVPAKPISPSG